MRITPQPTSTNPVINFWGPILQFRGVAHDQYRLSALVVLPLNNLPPQASLLSAGTVAAPHKVADLPFDKPTKTAWRYDISVPLSSGPVIYVLDDFKVGLTQNS